MPVLADMMMNNEAKMSNTVFHTSAKAHEIIFAPSKSVVPPNNRLNPYKAPVIGSSLLAKPLTTMVETKG